MKLKAMLLGAAAFTMLFAATVPAEVFTTSDGVLSIETPNDLWKQTEDPNYWFVISNGRSSIAIDHLSNGESLPAPVVADANYGAVYQSYGSTRNEVFVVKGLAAEVSDLQALMEIIGTLKVLKYNTKTAVASEAEKPSGYSVRSASGTYYSITNGLRVRSSYSIDSAEVGTLSYGEPVTVTGVVTKDGADYGWFQIQYGGTTAYISAQYLSQTQPEQQQKERKEEDTANPTRLADGFTCYDYKGDVQGLLIPYSDGYYYSNDMVKYKDNGDGSYTSNYDTLYDYNPVTGDPTDAFEPDQSTENGETYDSDIYYLESQGSGRPVTVFAGSDAYYDNDGVSYYNQYNGTFIDENGDWFNVVY